MSEVDKMFEKLGFKLEYKDINAKDIEKQFGYENEKGIEIFFYADKTLRIIENGNYLYANKSLLQAINGKVKELGWNE